MSKDHPPKRVTYYRVVQRDDAGGLVYQLRFYDRTGVFRSTTTVPAIQLNDELDKLRKQGLRIQRLET